MDIDKQYSIITLAERILVSIVSDPNVSTPDIEFCFAIASDFVNRAEKFKADNEKLNKLKEELK